MTEIHTDKPKTHGLDLPTDRTFTMSLGFRRARPPMPPLGPGSFGHPGSGGSIGEADPDARVGFAYVTSLWNFRADDPRAAELAKDAPARVSTSQSVATHSTTARWYSGALGA